MSVTKYPVHAFGGGLPYITRQLCFKHIRTNRNIYI